MAKGNVVWLNGTSSAGKTSIARCLQEVMEDAYVLAGADHRPSLPARFLVISDGVEPASSDYYTLVYPGGAERVVELRKGGQDVYGLGRISEVRIGPKGVHFVGAVYRSWAALADAGLNVVIDDVVHDQRVLRVAVDAFRDSNVLFVGLYLPLEVAERREVERGDRGPGGAAAFYHKVHVPGIYDLTLDTSQLTAMGCALRIKAELESGRPRRAVAELARVLGAR